MSPRPKNPTPRDTEEFLCVSQNPEPGPLCASGSQSQHPIPPCPPKSRGHSLCPSDPQNPVPEPHVPSRSPESRATPQIPHSIPLCPPRIQRLSPLFLRPPEFSAWTLCVTQAPRIQHPTPLCPPESRSHSPCPSAPRIQGLDTHPVTPRPQDPELSPPIFPQPSTPLHPQQ